MNENPPEFGRPVDPIPKEIEGTNAYLYWACTRLGEEFMRLPDVTPLQIKTARALTKFLTGNLDVLQLCSYFNYMLQVLKIYRENTTHLRNSRFCQTQKTKILPKLI